MDVTIQNFRLVRDEFLAQCATCEFYAIDQEMTGINATGDLRDVRQSFGAVPSDHYPCSRSAAMSYCAFQIGVCFYHKVATSPSAEDASEGDASTVPVQYEVRPYNFWLRPQAADACGAGNNDGDGVMLNMSGVDFLLSNSMDFQFWLKNGMPYTTPEDAKKIQSKLECSEIPSIFDLHPDTAQWVADSLQSAKEWILADEDNISNLTLVVPQPPSGISPKGLKVLHHILFVSIRPTSCVALYDAELTKEDALHPLALDALEGNTSSEPVKSILRLIPFFLNLNTPGTAATYFKASPRLDAIVPNVWRLPKSVTLTRFASREESDIYETEHDEIVTEKIRDATGFLPFFEALVACRKPQIGHNYSSDLMFLINQHHQSPLPDNLQDFTAVVSEAFPRVYDTKTLSGNMPEGVTNTSLGALYASLCKRMIQRFGPNRSSRSFGNTGESSESSVLQLRLPTGFESYSSLTGSANGGGAGGGSAVAHQGAYDAFMTGVVYLQLQLLYGHRSFVEPYMGWISMFGCPYSFCVNPDTSILGSERLLLHRGYSVDVFENIDGCFVGESTEMPCAGFGCAPSVCNDRIVAVTNTAVSKAIAEHLLLGANEDEKPLSTEGTFVVKVRSSFHQEPEWKRSLGVVVAKEDGSADSSSAVLTKQGSWLFMVSVATTNTSSYSWTVAAQNKLRSALWSVADEKVAVLHGVADCLSPKKTSVSNEGGNCDEKAVDVDADGVVECPTIGSQEWSSLVDAANKLVATLPSGIDVGDVDAASSTKIGEKRLRSL